MTNFNHLKQSAKVAAIAVSLTAGYATLASAHSIDACINAVYDFCGSDQACIQSGSTACIHHGHPGGNPPPPPDPYFSADPGHQFNKTFKFKKLRR